jgi:hypothetical protein
MKQILFLITLLIVNLNFTQDSTDNKKETPTKTVTILNFGESLQFEDIRIKFVEVVQDSRCPKNVTCIWAGEVVVLVAIYNKGKKLEQKKLTLSPTSQLQDIVGNLYASETLKLTGFNVFPYPETKAKIDLNDYYLEIQIN